MPRGQVAPPRGRLTNLGFVAFAGATSAAFVLILLAVFAWRDRVNIRMEAETLALNTAVLLEEHARTLFDASDFVLLRAVELGGPPGADIPQSEAVHDALERLSFGLQHVDSLYLVGPDGRLLATSREYPARELDLSDRAYFQDLRRGDDYAVDLVSRTPFTGRDYIIMARPLRGPDGAFRGMAAASIAPLYFQRFYENVRGYYDLSVALVEADGRWLVRQPLIPEPTPGLPALPIADALPPQGGVFTALSPASQPLLYAARRVGDRRVHLVLADDGIGLPESFSGETGLGLVLVRSLAAQIGATVRNAPRPGGGTIWTIGLPVEPPAA